MLVIVSYNLRFDIGVMKRNFKQLWSININKAKNHLSSPLTEHKKTTTSDVEKPGLDLRQSQTCSGIKLMG
jgi:hypothetical protein